MPDLREAKRPRTFETEIQEGYVMAVSESIEVIFQKLLSADEIKWVMNRLNKWVEFELNNRLRKQ